MKFASKANLSRVSGLGLARSRVSALKLRHPTACPAVQRKQFFVDVDTISLRRGIG
jgi:hypothetical protein